MNSINYFNYKEHLKKVVLKLADSLPQDTNKHTSKLQGWPSS